MNDKERVNAIFYHASILYVENDYMTNKTVRDRFGLTSKQSALATKIISSAVKSGKLNHMMKMQGTNSCSIFLTMLRDIMSRILSDFCLIKTKARSKSPNFINN